MMSAKKITIGIVDDHTLFRSGLSSLLSEFNQIDVVFEASDGLDLQHKLKSHSTVQVLLMDIHMPYIDGFTATRWVKEHYPQVQVLALSMIEEEKDIIHMLKAGAGGYMLKESKPVELLASIQTIAEKGFYLNDLVSGRLIITLKQETKPQLSTKELIFMQLCSTDMTYKEIASHMGISPRTVDNYREALFLRLNVKSRTGLVVYGIREKLIKI